METRWTVPRPDGQPHNGIDPVTCAHCPHIYQGFDYLAIVNHCRENHREFYKFKWDSELSNAMHVDPAYAPLPVVMKWSKRQALSQLGITQIKFDPPPELGTVHGYAKNGKQFAVSPNTPFPGAAGFHEIAHVMLGHAERLWLKYRHGTRNEYLNELEACAVAIICLRELGARAESLDAQRAHYTAHRRTWAEIEGSLPADFKAKVNVTARQILEAGRVS